jgi:hypothetical protein
LRAVTSIEESETRKNHDSHTYYHPEECTPGVGIEYHHDEYYESSSNDKIPIFLGPGIVREYSREEEEKCSHCIGTIEKPLKSAYICAINPMKYRRDTIACRPGRWITTISSIEEEILREWPLEETAHD